MLNLNFCSSAQGSGNPQVGGPTAVISGDRVYYGHMHSFKENIQFHNMTFYLGTEKIIFPLQSKVKLNTISSQLKARHGQGRREVFIVYPRGTGSEHGECGRVQWVVPERPPTLLLLRGGRLTGGAERGLREAELPSVAFPTTSGSQGLCIHASSLRPRKGSRRRERSQDVPIVHPQR